MNKKIVWPIILILTVFLTFTACSNSQTNGTPKSSGTASSEIAPEKNEDTKAPILKEVKVTVLVPDDWKKVEGSSVQMHYQKNTASFIIKKESPDADTLDKIMEEANAAFSRTFNNVSIQGDVERVQVDGNDARKVVFTCEVSKMKMKYLYVIVIVNGNTYAITIGDFADSFDSLSADYESILANIKFE